MTQLKIHCKRHGVAGTGKIGDINITGTTNSATITGLSNITWSGTTTTPTKAATEGQLADIVDGKSDNAVGGWGLTGDTGTAKANIGETLAVTGDNNIETEVTAGTGVQVKLKKDVNLTDKGSLTVGAASVNNSGLTVGSSSVTGSQIKTGTAILNSNGTASFGDVKVNADKTITGLSNVTWDSSATLTDAQKTTAATQGQLQQAVSDVKTNSTDYRLVAKDGGYNVDKATHKVTLQVEDKNHSSADPIDVVINDVASATDLSALTTKVNGGWGLTADKAATEGGSKTVKADVGNTLNITGGSNITTKAIANGVEIALDKNVDLTSAGSLTVGAAILDNTGLAVGTTKVGTSGFTVGTSSFTETQIALGSTTIKNDGTASFGTSANKVIIDGSAGTISAGSVSFNAAGTGSVGNIKFNQDADKATNTQHLNTVTGLSNTAWNQNGTYNAGRAATEEQLQAAISGVTSSVATQGLNFKGDNGVSVHKDLGGTIAIVGGQTDSTKLSNKANIGVVNEGEGLKIKLADDISVNSVSVNNVTAANGINVANGALTADNTGVNATVGTSSLDVNSDSTTITKGTGSDTNALKVDAKGTTFTHGTGEGATSTNINGSTITAGVVAINGAAGTIDGLTNKTWDPTKDYSNSGKAATEAQLAQLAVQAGKSSSVSSANDNIKVTKTTANNETNYEVKLGNNLKVGDATEDGSITLARKDGTSAEIGVVKKDGSTRIQYKDAEGNSETVATLKDGMKYGGDSGEALNMQLNQQVNIKGGVSDSSKLSEGNIGVVAGSNNTLNIKLSKELKGLEKVEVGDTTIDNKGLTVKGDGKKTKDINIKQGNVDMGGNVVSGIAPGKVSKDSTDAVNGAQMSAVVDAINGVGEGLNTVSAKVDKLGGRVNQVGARAAALAALHPLEFDPDEKLTFSAGYGHYHGESAGAIGAYYRPDEKILLSISGTMANKENMFNAGISFALDRNPHPSVSKPVMARQIVELSNKIETLTQQNAEMMAAINNADAHQYTTSSYAKAEGKSMLTMVRMEFTNLPEGHWGYNYLKELINKGYLKAADANTEDGKLMSRYEFAKALYSAIVNGAPVDNNMGKGMDEFGKEMDNIAKAARFRNDGLRAN